MAEEERAGGTIHYRVDENGVALLVPHRPERRDTMGLLLSGRTVMAGEALARWVLPSGDCYRVVEAFTDGRVRTVHDGPTEIMKEITGHSVPGRPAGPTAITDFTERQRR